MWYDRIKNYFDKGYYTVEQVMVFVPRYITQEQANEIVGA